MSIRSVLFTNSHAELGGGEMALLAHIRHLRDQGVAVSVFLLDTGPLRGEIEALGTKVIESSFAWQGSKIRSALLILHRVYDLYRCMRKERPDLVISYTFNDFIFAGLAAKLMGCPIIYRAQGEVFPDANKHGGGWLQGNFSSFARFVQPKILCTTTYEARNMIASGVPASLVSTVYLGIAKSEPAVAKRTDRSKPVLGIFGRLVRWKGQDTFVQAMGELAKRDVAFEAWIVGGSNFGDGAEYEQELHRLIDANGVSDQVKLLGFRRDVPDLMSQCDVVCHCSDFEPFGLVIIEAMMAGKPVVASDVSGPRESVLARETGFLVAPRKPALFADNIQILLADASLCERFSRAAKRRAEAYFDLERNLKLIDDECRLLLSAKAKVAKCRMCVLF